LYNLLKYARKKINTISKRVTKNIYLEKYFSGIKIIFAIKILRIFYKYYIISKSGRDKR